MYEISDVSPKYCTQFDKNVTVVDVNYIIRSWKNLMRNVWVQIEFSDFSIGVFLFQGKNVKSQRLWYKSIHLTLLLSMRNNWDILRPPLWFCFPVGWYKADKIGESKISVQSSMNDKLCFKRIKRKDFHFS